MSKQELETYFNNIEKEVEGVPASNIWNYDETNLRDDPGGKKAVMKKGTKYPERLIDSSKLCYSIMFCGNAEGVMLPPYVVYKSMHLYDTWVKGRPKDARFNRTRSGWFDEVTFDDWFFSLVLPKLRKQDGKKVLIGDNLSSHLSNCVIEACNNHNIAFVCLFPNGTHLLQPLDVAYFAPLKKAWRALLFEWRKSAVGRQYTTLPKEQFAGLLKKLIDKLREGNGKHNLVNGFKACGLYPFNPEEVYAKLPSENTMSPSKALDQSLLDTLAHMRGSDAETTPTRPKKKRLDVQPGKSISANVSSESDESEEEMKDDTATDTEEKTQTSDPASEKESESESEADSHLYTSSNKLPSPKEKVLKILLGVHKSLDDSKQGHLYAVYYGQKYYWGKVQLCFADDEDEDDDVKSVEFSFLRYRGDGYWDFPKKLDVEMVDAKYVFYGPCTPQTTIAGKGYKIVDDEAAQGRYKLLKQYDIYATL